MRAAGGGKCVFCLVNRAGSRALLLNSSVLGSTALDGVWTGIESIGDIFYVKSEDEEAAFGMHESTDETRLFDGKYTGTKKNVLRSCTNAARSSSGFFPHMRPKYVRGHHLAADALPADVPNLQGDLNIAFMHQT